ncbi:MAG: vitamin B12-dependent ribonucleotide reductase, partial [bacterium]|nr:vitamin B12-dependent ribonucleotide reductase [bacterium]
MLIERGTITMRFIEENLLEMREETISNPVAENRTVSQPGTEQTLESVKPRVENKRHHTGSEQVHEKTEANKGMRFERFFTKPGMKVFDSVDWELRDAVITSERGEVVFEQRGVEMPKSWSMLATNVVVSKYFKGGYGTPERENSLKQLIHRVTRTITDWGIRGNYFEDETSAENFYDELSFMMLHQVAAFNSPVWFNVGVEERPQCSACFINSVEDTMESILNLAKTEGMLFKYGSGTGTNLSSLRSSREKLTSGGIASGPVSFMKGYDAFAGVIKSGGKTRRAAKMVILNVGHPDIAEFVECKVKEEKKAWALIDAGYDGSFGGEAYGSVFFQNSNNSVRVPDMFMQAVEEGGFWQTRAVRGGFVVDSYKAQDLMHKIAEAAWQCGDPGLQFDTTINDWHTCANTDRIYASNPCSEYMFLDNSACNLSSINLLKFGKDNRGFDIEGFRHAVRTMILAQEIVIDPSSYPTPKIETNSHEFRPLGLGFANLGALLMSYGYPYDGIEARATAAAITALMTGEAYRMSAQIAMKQGPFSGFDKNRESMLRVIRKHQTSVDNISARHSVSKPLLRAAQQAWEGAYSLGSEYGYRNSQVTVLAPTGTIAFMMDCDTTGIEPDIALVKYKKLVGGGMLKIVNNTVPHALRALGYDESQSHEILKHIETKDTIEGCPVLKAEHLPVFDCAFKPYNGDRYIPYMAHVKMMAAVQPFLSGAISKTVNMPNKATVEEIEHVYLQAWKLGLKSIAIYRDGCKRTQPLNTSLEEIKNAGKAIVVPKVANPFRHKLPDERASITHKFSIIGHEGYITVGMYEDGSPGEVFIKMSKEGSTISGLMDAFATSISMALQYGVPLRVLSSKFQR